MAPPPYLFTVPFYAGVPLVRLTLQSVLVQDDPDWRCIVVDDAPDGSPDGEAVACLVAELDDARLVHERNPGEHGVAAAFNRCFEVAVREGAEFVTVLHADDLLEPSYVRVARAAHTHATDCTCVAPKVTVVGADGEPRRTLPDTVKALLWPRRATRLAGEAGLRALLRGQFFYCPAVSYRVDRLHGPDALTWNQRWGQVMDLELYARILLAGGVIGLVDDRIYRYRRHEGSATQVNSAAMVRSEEETLLCREVAAQARQLGWRRAARAGTVRATVRLQAAMRVLTSLRAGRIDLARQALRLSVGR
jgi:glycosyltransferase involved in cell wall biosynthesis